MSLTFQELRTANARRCIRWHRGGVQSWSASDWLTAITGELGELASLIKMRNRERDELVGNKFSPTTEMIAKEAADVAIYLDLFCEAHGIDLGAAIEAKFNEVSRRNGFPEQLGETPLKPIAWADKIAFESAMRSGKGCDVWPSRGDNPTRELIALAIVEEPQ